MPQGDPLLEGPALPAGPGEHAAHAEPLEFIVGHGLHTPVHHRYPASLRSRPDAAERAAWPLLLRMTTERGATRLASWCESAGISTRTTPWKMPSRAGRGRRSSSSATRRGGRGR